MASMKTTIYLDDQLYEWLRKYSFNNYKSMGETIRDALELYQKYRLTKNESLFFGGITPQLHSLHKLNPEAIEGIFGEDIFAKLGSNPSDLMEKFYMLSEVQDKLKKTKEVFALDDGIFYKIGYFGRIKPRFEVWRIDIDFMEKTGLKVRPNSYEIWVTEEFISDELHLPGSPNEQQIKTFARNFIEHRYNEVGQIPSEYGAFCSNKTKIRYVDASGTLLAYFNDVLYEQKSDVETNL